MLTSKRILYVSVATAIAVLVVAGTLVAARKFYTEKTLLEIHVAAVEAERDVLKEQVAIHRDYSIFLRNFYLPTNEKLRERGYSVVQASNPFLEREAEIRRIKKTSADLDDLWTRLRPLAETYLRGTDADLAVGAMLVVAAFYDFGNEPPYENLPGCAGNGQGTNFEQVPSLTFALHMSSDIGCCTDFTMLLGSFLEYLGYESQVMTNPAHQFLRVRIGDRWDLIDSTTRVYVRDYFSDNEKTIRSFAVGADRVYPYKSFFVKALAFEIETYGPDDWTIIPRAQQNRGYGASYLDDMGTRSM